MLASNILGIAIGLNRLSILNEAVNQINSVIYKRVEILNNVNSAALTLSIRIRDFMLVDTQEERQAIENDMSQTRKPLPSIKTA